MYSFIKQREFKPGCTADTTSMIHELGVSQCRTDQMLPSLAVSSSSASLGTCQLFSFFSLEILQDGFHF